MSSLKILKGFLYEFQGYKYIQNPIWYIFITLKYICITEIISHVQKNCAREIKRASDRRPAEFV